MKLLHVGEFAAGKEVYKGSMWAIYFHQVQTERCMETSLQTK